jgi:epoxyqueuosine reductase
MKSKADMDAKHLTAAWKEEAYRLGFASAGCCPAAEAPGYEKFRQWLEQGYAGQMMYLVERADRYQHPRSVLAEVRSVMMLTLPYRTASPRPAEPGAGLVSRYAWGSGDYHEVIHQRLRQLAGWLTGQVPGARVRGVVDTAPLMERDFAQLAGLGWIGKNTLLLNRKLGSWFFLAALLTDQLLAYDEPFVSDHCGSCTACLDACPTKAFPQPYVLDATRCISYLTIELRDSVPHELRPGLEQWVFGCDICQEVCPWNRKSPETPESPFQPLPEMNPLDLMSLFSLTDDEFRGRFRRTPLWRSKRRGILRNAALVLGNQRHLPAIPRLAQGLDDPEWLVRAACAWALGRMGSEADKELWQAAREVLELRLPREEHFDVRDEILRALGGDTIRT